MDHNSKIEEDPMIAIRDSLSSEIYAKLKFKFNNLETEVKNIIMLLNQQDHKILINALRKYDELQRAVKEEAKQESEEIRDCFKKAVDDLTSLIVKDLDFSTAPNTAVFWTGFKVKNQHIAMAYAAKIGKCTLEMTVGGKFLNELNLHGDNGLVATLNQEGEKEWLLANTLFDAASKQFAKLAQGKVVAIILESILPESTYKRIEKDILQQKEANCEIVLREIPIPTDFILPYMEVLENDISRNKLKDQELTSALINRINTIQNTFELTPRIVNRLLGREGSEQSPTNFLENLTKLFTEESSHQQNEKKKAKVKNLLVIHKEFMEQITHFDDTINFIESVKVTYSEVYFADLLQDLSRALSLIKLIVKISAEIDLDEDLDECVDFEGKKQSVRKYLLVPLQNKLESLNTEYGGRKIKHFSDNETDQNHDDPVELDPNYAECQNNYELVVAQKKELKTWTVAYFSQWYPKEVSDAKRLYTERTKAFISTLPFVKDQWTGILMNLFDGTFNNEFYKVEEAIKIVFNQSLRSNELGSSVLKTLLEAEKAESFDGIRLAVKALILYCVNPDKLNAEDLKNVVKYYEEASKFYIQGKLRNNIEFRSAGNAKEDAAAIILAKVLKERYHLNSIKWSFSILETPLDAEGEIGCKGICELLGGKSESVSFYYQQAALQETALFKQLNVNKVTELYQNAAKAKEQQLKWLLSKSQLLVESKLQLENPIIKRFEKIAEFYNDAAKFYQKAAEGNVEKYKNLGLAKESAAKALYESKLKFLQQKEKQELFEKLDSFKKELVFSKLEGLTKVEEKLVDCKEKSTENKDYEKLETSLINTKNAIDHSINSVIESKPEEITNNYDRLAELWGGEESVAYYCELEIEANSNVGLLQKFSDAIPLFKNEEKEKRKFLLKFYQQAGDAKKKEAELLDEQIKEELHPEIVASIKRKLKVYGSKNGIAHYCVKAVSEAKISGKSKIAECYEKAVTIKKLEAKYVENLEKEVTTSHDLEILRKKMNEIDHNANNTKEREKLTEEISKAEKELSNIKQQKSDNIRYRNVYKKFMGLLVGPNSAVDCLITARKEQEEKVKECYQKAAEKYLKQARNIEMDGIDQVHPLEVDLLIELDSQIAQALGDNDGAAHYYKKYFVYKNLSDSANIAAAFKQAAEAKEQESEILEQKRHLILSLIRSKHIDSLLATNLVTTGVAGVVAEAAGIPVLTSWLGASGLAGSVAVVSAPAVAASGVVVAAPVAVTLAAKALLYNSNSQKLTQFLQLQTLHTTEIVLSSIPKLCMQSLKSTNSTEIHELSETLIKLKFQQVELLKNNKEAKITSERAKLLEESIDALIKADHYQSSISNLGRYYRQLGNVKREEFELLTRLEQHEEVSECIEQLSRSFTNYPNSAAFFFLEAIRAEERGAERVASLYFRAGETLYLKQQLKDLWVTLPNQDNFVQLCETIVGLLEDLAIPASQYYSQAAQYSARGDNAKSEEQEKLAEKQLANSRWVENTFYNGYNHYCE